MRLYIGLLLLLLPIGLLSIVREVALDGSQPYSSIQDAINNAAAGDVILVHPGRYLENLNLSNKSDLTLCSLEYTTGDSSYIRTTIIDGSRANISTIVCYENVLNCTIQGLSITGGSGYDYFQGASPWQIFGGGIYINANCNLNLVNLDIYKNKASCGGGIAFYAPNTVNMSNVNIHDNVARYLGGGILIGSDYTNGPPLIHFDPVNRCSIYNNFAQWGMDIHWRYINGGEVAVYLKKFTVPTWEMYYADYYDPFETTSPYTVFDIQEGYLQPVEADLYVSPQGSDENDGLSPATALKTPSLAMQRIASNHSHRHTVYLSEGEHHNMFMGEYIPIALKDYTILKGVSETQTKLYGENMLAGTGVITFGIDRYGMSLQKLSITTSHASAMFSWGVFDSEVKNVTIENSSVDRTMVYMGYITSTFSMQNITMRNNTAYNYCFGMNLTGAVIKLDHIVMKDNQVPSLPSSEFDRGGGGFDIGIRDTLIISNSQFINNTLYSEDGWANFRVYSDYTQFSPTYTLENCLFAYNHTYSGARDFNFYDSDKLNLVNCTFANNFGTYLDYIFLIGNDIRVVNCIFSNNANNNEIASDPNALIENCLFSRAEHIYRLFSGDSLQWGTNNLIGTDPLFVGGDPASAAYYCLRDDDTGGHSPAIDTGTTDPAILPVGYQFPTYDCLGNDRIYGNGIDIGFMESPGYTDNNDPVAIEPTTLSVSNYPNPFNPSTTIRYGLPKDGNVRIGIYNVKGQLVKAIVEESKKAGMYNAVWNGEDQHGSKVSSGVYFLRIEANGKNVNKKILMMK